MGRPDRCIEAVRRSTAALVAGVERLSAEQIGQPSALPQWSRGHVLTHLARNADGLRALLLSARSGQPVAMYASNQARDADIEAGAGRPGTVIVEDFKHTTRALEVEFDNVDDACWGHSVVLHTTTGPQQAPLSALVDMRLREIEIHHVDLDVGHDFGTTDRETLALLLTYAAGRLSDQSAHRLELTASDGGDVYIVGAEDEAVGQVFAARANAAEILGYLTGRAATLPGLPPPPAWG